MALREVSGAIKYYKFSECKVGQVLVSGVYLKTEIGERFGKPEHLFQEKTGQVKLNSAGQLDYCLKAYVKEGDTVVITYLGKDESKAKDFNGKAPHQFKVEVDDEAINAVAAHIAAATTNAQETDSDDLPF